MSYISVPPTFDQENAISQILMFFLVFSAMETYPTLFFGDFIGHVASCFFSYASLDPINYPPKGAFGNNRVTLSRALAS